MSRRLQPHYLRPNHGEWTPATVIFLDTETRTVRKGDTELLTLRCWDAHVLDRRQRGKASLRDAWGSGTTRADLAAWVDEATRNRPSSWLFAHNLGFDLSTTRLPIMLVRRGWKITDASIGGKAPWLRLSKGYRSLAIVDSWGWLPYPLDQLAYRLAMRKPPLPREGDTEANWHARCRADVEILAAAMGQVMDWWDEHRLGHWTVTGAQCGWNAYRHRKPVQPILMDPDPDSVAHDRLAIYGGRRGTWVIGEHRAGPFLEMDLRAAYPTVAATLPLPVRRGRSFTSLPLTSPLLRNTSNGVLAQVTISTDVPRWPVRIDGHVWYPTGTFTTTLAGPDIAEALRLGCLVAVGPGRVHQLGANLTAWGQWVLATQDNTTGDVPPMAQLCAKAWGRSVLGKFAGRSFERTRLGTSPFADWNVEDARLVNEGVPGTIVDLGGARWLVSASGTPENVYPAVLAWVEAYVRTRLNRAAEAIGDGALIQCDTDGMIVAGRVLGTAAAHGHLRAPAGANAGQRLNWILDNLDPVIAPLQLRVKARHDHVNVIGPQHLFVGGQQRLSGIPKSARQVEPGTFLVTKWPGLAWQMTHGDPDGYVRTQGRSRLLGPYPSGWVLADGRVVPVQTRSGPGGTTTLLDWQSSSYGDLGTALGARQHKRLASGW